MDSKCGLPRALVVGGGGIGAITALNLAVGAEVDVYLVLRSNYNAVLESGYQISSIDHGLLNNWRPHHVLKRIPDVSDGTTEPFKYVVCTTKNISDCSPTTFDILQPAITPGVTVVVLIQNGLNIEAPFVSAVPTNIILSGISYMGSHEVSSGVIEQNYPDILDIGPFRNLNISQDLEEAAALDFVSVYGAGAKTSVNYTRDTKRSRWAKLLYNATMNPVCAILQMNTGALQESGAVKSLVRPAMVELCQVAAAQGVVLGTDVVNSTIQKAGKDAAFEPSMLVDVSKGNLIEFEAIIGEPMREAQKMGVPVPVLSLWASQMVVTGIEGACAVIAPLTTCAKCSIAPSPSGSPVIGLNSATSVGGRGATFVGPVQKATVDPETLPGTALQGLIDQYVIGVPKFVARIGRWPNIFRMRAMAKLSKIGRCGEIYR